MSQLFVKNEKIEIILKFQNQENMKYTTNSLIILILLFVCNFGFSQDDLSRIILKRVFTGVATPVALQNCNDNRMFIVQKEGIIKIGYPDGSVRDSAFLNISDKVSTGGERGLLGLAFPPDFKQSGIFYVNYTQKSDGGTVIARYRISADSNRAVKASEERLIEVEQPFSNHNGGNLEFGKDGYLYIGLGDGGSGGDPFDNSQNKQKFLGKMLRIDVSNSPGYKVPTDNPFVGNAEYRPEIWAMGLRNPWRFKFDERTGDLWIADVGQDKWEEIDFEEAGDGGHNYGWRCYEGYASYNTDGCGDKLGYTFPVAVFGHNEGHCSITGGVVDIKDPNSSLYGYYYATDYCSGTFWGTKLNPDKTFTTIELAKTGMQGFVAFGYDNQKNIYVARENGHIFRIDTFVLCVPDLVIEGTDTEVGCKIDTVVLSTQDISNGQYTWYFNGQPIDNSNSRTIAVTKPGSYSVQFDSPECSATSNNEYKLEQNKDIDVEILDVPDNYCLNGAPLVFHGKPAGGGFFGIGMIDSVFYPSLSDIGTFFITYSYESEEGCNGFDVGVITVNHPPGTKILSTPPQLCQYAAPIELEATPAEGYWSGPGLTGSTFYPYLAGIGVHKIKYTYNPWPGCYAYDSIFITVIDCTINSAEIDSPEIVISPNPVKDILVVAVKNTSFKPEFVSIVNSLGKEVVKKKLEVNRPAEETIKLSFEGLVPGMYHVVLTAGDKRLKKKVIKL